MLSRRHMRHRTEPSFGFASLLSGNALFETTACTLGMGRPTERGLLADALRHAGVNPRSVTRSQLLLLMPEIERRLARVIDAGIAAERVRALCSYLDRETASAA